MILSGNEFYFRIKVDLKHRSSLRLVSSVNYTIRSVSNMNYTIRHISTKNDTVKFSVSSMTETILSPLCLIGFILLDLSLK